MMFSVANFKSSCSILIVYSGVVSPTLNVNPTLFVTLCKFWRDNSFIMLQFAITYQVITSRKHGRKEPQPKSAAVLFNHVFY